MQLYYSLGGNITSLSGLFYPQSFCSPIIRGILRHLWGRVPSIALSLPDERGFPIWYAVKVIWIAVMFLYNMHCQAKTGKHFFPPKNSFQPCFSLQPPQIYCTYMNTPSFLLRSRTRLWFCRTEMKNVSAVTRNLKDILVVENRGVLTEKNVDFGSLHEPLICGLFTRGFTEAGVQAHIQKEVLKKQNICPIICVYILQYIDVVWHIYILFQEIIWGDISGKHFCFWQCASFVNSV